MKKLSRTKQKIPGAQPTTPTASTAAIPALLPEDSPATEGTCVMPDGGDAENAGAPYVMRLDEQTREDSSPVHSGYELLGVDATRKTFHELDGELGGLSDTVVHTIAKITPYLASMQALLSQRGKDRKKVLKLAGVPTWTQWATEYATKLNCTVRTIQSRIKSLRQPRKDSGTKGKPLKLDGRQQRALVTAQVAANDLAAALKNAGDCQTALAEYERVAVSPKRLDGFLSALDPGPDWQELLRGFLGMVQKDEDGLSDATVKEMRRLQQLSGGAPNQSPAITGQQEESTGVTSRIPIPAPPPQTRRHCGNAVQPTELPGDCGPHLATRDEAEPSAHAVPAFLPTTGARAPERPTETLPSPRSKSIKPVKVTSGAPVTDAEGEDRGNRVLPDATDYIPSVITQAHWARTESGRWEFVGFPD
jgi:hypothetical protein